MASTSRLPLSATEADRAATSAQIDRPYEPFSMFAPTTTLPRLGRVKRLRRSRERGGMKRGGRGSSMAGK
jgi:hypothetical protein